MNGMSLVNTAIVIFAGSVVLLNDPSIETTTALGLIVMFTQFSQQYYQPIIQVAASWGASSWPLLGQIVSKKCSMRRRDSSAKCACLYGIARRR